jgi:hypothetical protein
VGAGLALSGPAGLGLELVRACGLVLGALFLLLSLRSRAPLFGRALLAVVLTALAVMGWEWARGISWPEVQQSFTGMLRKAIRPCFRPPAPENRPSPRCRRSCKR